MHKPLSKKEHENTLKSLRTFYEQCVVVTVDLRNCLPKKETPTCIDELTKAVANLRWILREFYRQRFPDEDDRIVYLGGKDIDRNDPRLVLFGIQQEDSCYYAQQSIEKRFKRRRNLKPRFNKKEQTLLVKSFEGMLVTLEVIQKKLLESYSSVPRLVSASKCASCHCRELIECLRQKNIVSFRDISTK